MDGENFQREGDFKNCFKTYENVARQFEAYVDYETASYFHKRCLDISNEFKYLEGQAQAFKGLGICEEKVYNKFEAKENLETALEKAVEGKIHKIELEVQKDLVRVYQLIAQDFQSEGNAEDALAYFNKCLEMTQKVKDTDKEAECYQNIANIYEDLGQMNEAISYLEKFLDISVQSNNNEKLQGAYKRLSEVESKNGNTSKAIEYLGKVLSLAN